MPVLLSKVDIFNFIVSLYEETMDVFMNSINMLYEFNKYAIKLHIVNYMQKFALLLILYFFSKMSHATTVFFVSLRRGVSRVPVNI